MKYQSISFEVPKNNIITTQYKLHMGSENEITIAIVTRSIVTGIFTLFELDNDTYKKVATKNNPNFDEINKLYDRLEVDA